MRRRTSLPDRSPEPVHRQVDIHERPHDPPTPAPSRQTRPPAGRCRGRLRHDVDGWIHVGQRRVAFGIRRCNLNGRNGRAGNRRNVHHYNVVQQHDRCNASDHSGDDANDDGRHYRDDSEGIDAVKLSP